MAKKKDWSSAYKPENIEIRYIKTAKDLARELELLKTEVLTKCIEYKVASKYQKIFNDKLLYGRD
jgi:hypothetical protein